VRVYAVIVRRSAANAAQEALGILHALELDVRQQALSCCEELTHQQPMH